MAMIFSFAGPDTVEVSGRDKRKSPGFYARAFRLEGTTAETGADDKRVSSWI
jgi:hypothetical protein